MTITSARPASSRRNSKQRAQFARQMVLAEFGYRHGRALDQSDFVDRLPHQRPPRMDEIGRRQ